MQGEDQKFDETTSKPKERPLCFKVCRGGIYPNIQILTIVADF